MPRRESILVVAVICLVTVVSYVPVIFDFFVGDDFVNLVWARDVVQNPTLLLREFVGPTLKGQTTALFYRPVISVLTVVTYLMFGVNGLGFHVTNLLLLLANVCLVYLLVREFVPPDAGERLRLIWPAISAALFGLYPLHSETVAWVTGKVDAVVTMFCLLSFWCYIRWRYHDGKKFFIGTLASMLLALLSKEMAVTLPGVFMAYELIVGVRPGSLLQRLSGALQSTLPFWLLLGAWFLFRFMAIGTFIGGYDDSLSLADPRALALSWLHGIRMIFAPINRSTTGIFDPIAIGWMISLLLVVAASVVNMLRSLEIFRRGAFLVCWFGLSLLPVYKVFSIDNNLQGSRLAFLATVPLCCFLGLALAKVEEGEERQPGVSLIPRIVPVLGAIFMASLLSIAFLLQWKSNVTWANAGREANSIRSALEQFCSTVRGARQVVVLGLPDQRDGAFVARNSNSGLIKRPVMSRDLDYVMVIGERDPIVPFGFFKDSLMNSRRVVTVLSWHSPSKQFLVRQLERLSPRTMVRGRSVVGSQPEQNQSRKLSFSSVSIEPGDRRSVEIEAEMLPCSTIDFLRVELDLRSVLDNRGMDLFFKNSIVPEYTQDSVFHFDIDRQHPQSEILISLRSFPRWCLGGKAGGFRLLLPKAESVTVKSVEIVPAADLMPFISFPQSGFDESRGFLHVGGKLCDVTVEYNARVPEAAGVLLEITRLNTVFAFQNSSRLSKEELLREERRSGTTGSISLPVDMFPRSGLYEARAWATNAHGQRIGVAGDHVVVLVDEN